MEAILVPIGFFAAITVMLSLFFWFRYRTRGDMQQTIRTAIDRGQELSPEIIDRLATLDVDMAITTNALTLEPFLDKFERVGLKSI